MGTKEITDQNALNEERRLIVLVKVGKLAKGVPRAKFNASSLRAASDAVVQEVQAHSGRIQECLGAVVFDADNWPQTVAWIHHNGRVYDEEPNEWRAWLE